jgi:hypothetical protein
MMKHILSTILLLLSACVADAAGGRFSYLYIQGDKQTPFYVKLEDAMQPRYGKNYCIIPKLAPGPAHIEVLFQKNEHPAQKFTVLIPEGGSRGFLLVKADHGFMLYDLQQNFYLPAGNRADQDHLPLEAVPVPVDQAAAIEEQGLAAQPEPASSPGVEQRVTAPQQQQPAETTPEFISGIEFSKGAQRDSGNTARVNAAAPAIANSDCPTPLSSDAFTKVFSSVSRLATDEDKIEYLSGQMNYCYETWQARTLAGRLESDVARYDLFRRIYPRITDQGAFPLLDDLLTSDTWKAEFNRLIRH